MQDSVIFDIPHIIQLAIAPVFLIAGISNLLNVLTSRLARVVDRGRVIAAAMADAPSDAEKGHWREELGGIDQRMSRINLAITLSTIALLSVCLLICALFAGEVASIDLSLVVVALFVLTMAALIAGLIAFLMEIRIATNMLRIPTRLLTGR